MLSCKLSRVIELFVTQFGVGCSNSCCCVIFVVGSFMVIFGKNYRITVYCVGFVYVYGASFKCFVVSHQKRNFHNQHCDRIRYAQQNENHSEGDTHSKPEQRHGKGTAA